MPLELQPLQEKDIDAYVRISLEAFQDDILTILYPNGYPPGHYEYVKSSTLKNWQENAEAVYLIKVVDTDLPADDPDNQIVGVARWQIFRQARTEEELDAEDAVRRNEPAPPGADPAVHEAFVASLLQSKRSVMGGRPHVILRSLATHPRHHRRGAGALHLRWGIEQADKLNLPTYLTASTMGRPLYERFGYEKVMMLPFDGRLHGATTEMNGTCMLRPARTTTKAT